MRVKQRGGSRKEDEPKNHYRGMPQENERFELRERQSSHVTGERERRSVRDRLEPSRKKRDRQDVASEKHDASAYDPLERRYLFKNESAKSDVQSEEREHYESAEKQEQGSEDSSCGHLRQSDEIRADSERKYGHDRKIGKRSRKNFEDLENRIRNGVQQVYGDFAGFHVFGNPPGEIRRTHRSDLGINQPPSELLNGKARKHCRRSRVEISEKAYDEQYPHRIGSKRRKHVENVYVPLLEGDEEDMPVFEHGKRDQESKLRRR